MDNQDTAGRCPGICCDSCVEDFYSLIESLINEIQRLEAKVVGLRYTLSEHLPIFDGEMLRCDIFSDLSGRFWDNPAYREYIDEYNFGQDPQDDAKQTRLMIKISRGEKTVNL